MKRLRAGGEGAAPSAVGSSGPGPELPAWKAFVVQFSRDAEAHAGVFSGRVEHLSSGRRARFASREDLLAILERELEELEKSGD